MARAKKPIIVPRLIKEVLDEHGLGGNASAVFLHYALNNYTLEKASFEIESELLNDRQRHDVMSALRYLDAAQRIQPLSFNQVEVA